MFTTSLLIVPQVTGILHSGEQLSYSLHMNFLPSVIYIVFGDSIHYSLGFCAIDYNWNKKAAFLIKTETSP